MTKGSLTVHSDTMVVTFKQQDAAASAKPGSHASGRSSPSPDGGLPERGGAALPTMGSRSVSMIEATGRVRIEKDDGTATCQKAVYYGDDERIVLTGEPVAWQKGTRVTGQKITLYLAEDRSVVEGGSRVMIEPEEAQRR
jgi:lipopolysaccharide export system protein LptA